MAVPEIPRVRASGAEIPVIGLGTGRLKGEAGVRAIVAALGCGYRHLDTAAKYANEREVGEALRIAGVPRGEVFLTTKVWPSEAADGAAQRSAEQSLSRLGVDEVDLLLAHWPSPDVPLAEQIGALCDARRRGLARHIGVSNFPPLYLEAAIALADAPIVVNQVEYHPYLDQSALFATCRREGVAVTSYVPLGRGAPLADPLIVALARDKQRTPAQIVLRWHVQQEMNVAIPRSSDPERIAGNIAIFDFRLSDAEMADISALARPDGRIVDPGYPPDWNGAPA